jgi:hypothetical protein
MRWVRNVLLSAALLACVPAQAAQPWVVRFDGVGPLRYGMTFDEVNAQLGHRLQRTAPELLATKGCEQIPLDELGRKGIWLMFVDNVFRRVDIERGARTAAGIAVGDPVPRVYAAYKALAPAPRPYEDAELSLTVRAPDGRHALRFDTEKGAVALVIAGDQAPVQWMEGCL